MTRLITEILKPLSAIFLVVFCLVGPASAAGWSQAAKIDSIEIDASANRLFVRFASSIGNPDSCGQTDLYVYRLDTYNNPERMLSFLMSAFHAQSDVTLYLSGCVPIGTYGFSASRPSIAIARVNAP
ncbi:MAG: hypothetical protein AAF642_01365 [Pseudomonadota bacterium]